MYHKIFANIEILINDRMQCDGSISGKLAAGRSLNNDFCQGGCGKRSCPNSLRRVTQCGVDRIPNLPAESRTFYHWANRRPKY